MPTPLVLASASPRRAELLQQMNLSFAVMPEPVDEEAFSDPDPTRLATAIAAAKAEACRAKHGRSDSWILAADTVVYAQGTSLGKPSDRHHAREMLHTLAGHEHVVITGLALTVPGRPDVHRQACETRVWFAPLDHDEVEWYLDSGEWDGVAGAYRIQGRAACFITAISGSYSNVVGLPIHTLYSILTAYHYPVRETG